MKSTVKLISQKDRELLAHFYESETYKALVNLLTKERLEIAKDHVEQTEILNVRYLSGQAASLKKLVNTLKENHKKVNKES